MNLSDNYIKLILTLASKRLVGTHPTVSGDREDKPRGPDDIA